VSDLAALSPATLASPSASVGGGRGAGWFRCPGLGGYCGLGRCALLGGDLVTNGPGNSPQSRQVAVLWDAGGEYLTLVVKGKINSKEIFGGCHAYQWKFIVAK
jgi:hypothetical protein